MSGVGTVGSAALGEIVPESLGYPLSRTMFDELHDWRHRIRLDLEGWQGLQAVLPAVVTYTLSAIGLRLAGTTLGDSSGGPFGGLEAFGFVAVFTVFHGFLPAALFGLVWRMWRSMGGIWGWLTLGTLYGVPIWILAEQTGWIGLLGAAAHVAMAPRGTRRWVGIEYGSSSFCLMLFLIGYEGGLFPGGLFALAFQAGLLLVMHLTVRHLWIDHPASESPAVTTRAI